MIINGDLVDTGMNEAQWNWLQGHGKDMFQNTTVVPVAGNHDEDKNSFYEHFNPLRSLPLRPAFTSLLTIKTFTSSCSTRMRIHPSTPSILRARFM